MTYDTKYNFVKLKNIDDIEKLPLDYMFNLMREHHKKFNSLINLKAQTLANKNKRLEVLIHVGNIYCKLYNIYRSKHNKEIDSMSAKTKKMFDYKQLKISGDSQYSSDEELEQEKQKKQEEQEEQDKNHLI